MKHFELSLHAIEQALARNIPQKFIFEAIENPDKIEDEAEGQLVYQKLVKFSDGKEHILRVFVNAQKNPKLIKTVYRTSKIWKFQ